MRGADLVQIVYNITDSGNCEGHRLGRVVAVVDGRRVIPCTCVPVAGTSADTRLQRACTRRRGRERERKRRRRCRPHDPRALHR